MSGSKRVNILITEDLYLYLRYLAWLNDKSIAKCANDIMESLLFENRENIETALKENAEKLNLDVQNLKQSIIQDENYYRSPQNPFKILK